MNKLKINFPQSMGVTIIPNYFLDTYMPQANGEFVKIYLYLLRAAQTTEFSLNTIADSMNCTEKDVMRALKYWAKEGLLSLTFDESKKLEGILFLIPSPNTASDGSELQNTILEPTDPVPAAAAVSIEDSVASSASETETSMSVTPSSDKIVPQPEKAVSVRQKPLNADTIRQLKENEDIAQLLFIAEQYLGKTLTPMETSRILYFYDELGFSTDLIEYLIEYCVGNNHRSINYIEKVALNWKEQGIVTVEAAKKTASGYHKDYYTIFKALGIRNRSPIEAEIAAMKNWLTDFSMELIVEACTRTVLTTKQPDLKYVNGILESWKKAGARTLQDVQRLDTAHEQAKSEKKLHRNTKTTATRFSNFDQRAYDFDTLESQLLNQ